MNSKVGLKDLVVTDRKVTGENFYILKTSNATDRASVLGPYFPISGPKVEGDLWRGSPTRGGAILVKKALFMARLRIRLNPKRPVEDRFKPWCFYLFKDEASLVLVPVFSPIRTPDDIHRVYLKELRSYTDLHSLVGQGNWIIIDPFLLAEGSEIPAKIQIRGKFYPAKVQKAPAQY